uniref:Putative mucin-5ac-like protein n=2 Tax=Lutzomyia longipalpis TaxID=7200 RepID=A0A1B0CHM1_LUTLO
QCSAGTLPVAWVDEGPGPPRCPPPCATVTTLDKMTNENNKVNMEGRFNDKQQQCLDYIGDNEESSPAQICKKSSRDIETKLRALRLRHCCERSAISALHSQALEDVLKGGIKCNRLLNDLLETDALATRITCEFTEILVRYDCRQPYSIINHCEDCKEAYRRWVCSTLIPYFAEKKDVKNNETTQGGKYSVENKSRVNRNIQANHNRFGEADENSLTEVLKRSRRKSKTMPPRRRIRPCLDVCQTVEQKCPYMLPGDRAPAHPTQYAGEPTFLCLDPNIPETGEQFHKSNNGPENCCYTYCGSPGEGLCSQCDLPATIQHKNNDTSNLNNKLNTTTSKANINTKNNNQKAQIANDRGSDVAIDGETEPFDYDEIPQQLPVCQSTTSVAIMPQTRCPIPYYVSPSFTSMARSILVANPTSGAPDQPAPSGAMVHVPCTWLMLATLLLRFTFGTQLPWTIHLVPGSNIVVAAIAPATTTWIHHILPQLAGL